LKTLILVDTFGVLFRSYFAFGAKPLVNSKGVETSVIFGFFNTLYRLIRERPFDHFACVLDMPGPTFRDKIDPNYKAHRPETPDSLKKQIAETIELLPLLGVPHIGKTGFEADDVIATLSTRAAKAGYKVEIVSSDKDLCQLVGDQVCLLQNDKKTGDWIEFGSEHVKEKWGVPPTGIVDLFALIGDTSDNVPGVKGIGPKTAVKLFEKRNTLDELYAHLDEVKPDGVKEKLKTDKENAYLSQKLVTVEREVPDMPTIEELDFKPFDQTKALNHLQEWELTRLIRNWGLDQEGLGESFTLRDLSKKSPSASKAAVKKSSNAAGAKESAEMISTPMPSDFKRETVGVKELSKVIEAAELEKLFVFDLETTGLDSLTAKLVAIVFAFPSGKSFYIRTLTKENDLNEAVLKKLKPIFENESIGKIGHNLKFETSMLGAWGTTLKGLHFDTMLAAYLTDGNRAGYNLESLVESYFGYAKKTYSETFGKNTDLLEVEPSILETYTYEDGEYTWKLYEKLLGAVTGKEKQFFETIEMPMIPVLSKMERTGVILDTSLLKKLSGEMKDELEGLEKNIHSEAGEEFNINSTKQLQEILFVKKGIKPIKKNKTGFSTDVEVLEKLAPNHSIANYLLRYRLLTKLKSTYIDALPELISPISGRVHTSYNQAVAATGRLSSQNPNLQNIPIKEKEGRAIRRAFTAPPGLLLASFDYSQVELRILAYLSKDERLVQAYAQGRDIHRETASLLFGKKDDAIDDDERRIAKTINFSVIYGISAFSLGEQLGLPTREAQSFIDAYFAGYPGVRKMIDDVVATAKENSYVETFYGRKRPVPEINGANHNIRMHAERLAFNTVIQGTASDIIKIAMIEIHNQIEAKKIKATMVMQVHDELVFYLKPDDLMDQGPTIVHLMKNIQPFDKILDVSFKSGLNWEK
jgi:DNA polymerase-1